MTATPPELSLPISTLTTPSDPDTSSAGSLQHPTPKLTTSSLPPIPPASPRRSRNLRRRLTGPTKRLPNSLVRRPSFVRRGINRVHVARLRRRFDIGEEEIVYGGGGFGVVCESGIKGVMWVVESCMVIVEKGGIRGKGKEIGKGIGKGLGMGRSSDSEGEKEEDKEFVGRKVMWREVVQVVKVSGIWKIQIGNQEVIALVEVEREEVWKGFVDERLKAVGDSDGIVENGHALGNGTMNGVRDRSSDAKKENGSSAMTWTSLISDDEEGSDRKERVGEREQVEEVDSDHAVVVDGFTTSEAEDLSGPDAEGNDVTEEESEQEHEVEVDDDFVWRTDYDPVDKAWGQEYPDRKERARITLNASVKYVFNLFFIPDCADYHKENGHTQVKVSDWTRGPDGYMSRTVGFVKQLGYRLGPKETRVEETHRYSFKSNGGALVEVEGKNLDVPFGSSFCVESFFELEPVAGNENACTLIATVAVHFVKKGWLCSKIENGTLEQTKEAFSKMLKQYQKTLDKTLADERARKAIEEKKKKEKKGKMEKTKNAPVGSKSAVVQNGAPAIKQRLDMKRAPVKQNIAVPRASANAEKGTCNERVKRSLEEDRTIKISRRPSIELPTPSPVPESSSTRFGPASNASTAPSLLVRRGTIGAIVLLFVMLLYTIFLLFETRQQVSSLERLLREAPGK